MGEIVLSDNLPQDGKSFLADPLPVKSFTIKVNDKKHYSIKI